MKISVESTDQIVTLNGVPARVWEGTTARGVRVQAFITRLAVDREDDGAEFEELSEHAPPTVDWPRHLMIDNDVLAATVAAGFATRDEAEAAAEFINELADRQVAGAISPEDAEREMCDFAMKQLESRRAVRS